MKLNKEECLKALETIYYPSDERNIFEQLIKEHFDNPPLKFEELEEGMWFWDNQQKEYFKINRLKIVVSSMNNYKYYIYPTYWSIPIEFEENRFYRNQVKNE